MILCDSHTHSNFSFDATESMEELCISAIEKGVSCIALTDHCDIDCVLDGLYPAYDWDAARTEFDRCRSIYGDRLEMVFGIEFGQGHLRQKEALNFMEKYGVEFVISSIHNLDRVPDYIFLNYEEIPQPMIDHLYERYVRELSLAARFPGAHTLAHITYPARYIYRDGRDIDITRFYDLYRELFEVMKECGIALELNTSGIRKGYGMSPDEGLLRLYRQCGGELVSCGSDTHIFGDVGADVADCVELLSSIGFRYLTGPTIGGAKQVLIK